MSEHNSIRVGFQDFPLVFVDSLSDFDGRLLLGNIDLNDPKISVVNTVRGKVAAMVLWHEAIHGVLNYSGLATLLDEKTEEAIVEAVSNGIIQILRDNPWMGSLKLMSSIVKHQSEQGNEENDPLTK